MIRRQVRSAAELIPVGEVMGAHGVSGEVKVKMHNPDSALLLDVLEVHVRRGERPAEVVRVEQVRVHGRGLVMQLSGCVDRDQARALYGAQLCVPRHRLPAPDDDEFYVVDAIGARVVRSDGRRVGTVESFRAYPTVDVLCVRSDDGLRELPLIAPYLVEVNVDDGRVVVDHFDDLELEPEPKPRRKRG